jgi:predicted Zn-dependent protease
MTRYLTEDWARDVRLQDLQAIDVNGLEAATAWTRIDTRQGEADFRLVAIRVDRNAIYRFLFVTPSKLSASLNAPLRRTTYSFRRLNSQELAELRPYRLDIYRVKSGDTPGRIARRMPLGDQSLDQFQVLNGLREGEPLRAGQRVKIVTD